ncbi:MAG: hypothetical protein CMJ32_07275 [Phycisphaerae bacterium]|nr:hypothetical protein [Phycisphaerae bacterium]
MIDSMASADSRAWDFWLKLESLDGSPCMLCVGKERSYVESGNGCFNPRNASIPAPVSRGCSHMASQDSAMT